MISVDNSTSTVANALILLRCAQDRRNCEKNGFGGPACSFAPAIWQTRCIARGSHKYLGCLSKRARRKAREILGQSCPRGGYVAVVENWRQLSDGQIEFTMRDLPLASSAAG